MIPQAVTLFVMRCQPGRVQFARILKLDTDPAVASMKTIFREEEMNRLIREYRRLSP
jgi:hypothetical protein